jgi:hypothetical protein
LGALTDVEKQGFTNNQNQDNQVRTSLERQMVCSGLKFKSGSKFKSGGKFKSGSSLFLLLPAIFSFRKCSLFAKKSARAMECSHDCAMI